MPKIEAKNTENKEEDAIAIVVRDFLEKKIEIKTASGDQQSFFVKDLYFEKDYARYELALVKLCKNNPEKVEDVLKKVEEKFIEREKSLRNLANVEKWIVAIMQSDLEHGQLKGDDLERQIEAVREDGSEAFARNFSNIEEDNRPAIIKGNLSSGDRNRVIDKKVIVKDNVRINNLDLEAFLESENAEGLTNKEKEGLRTRNEDINAISNAFEYLAHNGLGFVNAATRGIISESSVLDDSRFKKYHQKRGEFVMDWAKRNPSAAQSAIVGDVEANLVALEREMNEEGISADEFNIRKTRALRGKAELDGIKDFLSKKTQEMENQDAEVDAQLQEEFNKQNERLIHSEKEGQEGLNKLIKIEDDNQKWRIICGLLMLGPFAPVALVPLNILGPLMNVIGPIFSSGSLSAGLSSLLEIQGLGPITDFMEWLNLAEYAEIALDNCPVVSDLLGAMDGLLFNDITGGVMDIGGNPLMGSSFFPLAVGGTALALQGSREVLHHEDKTKALKYHKDQQKDLEGKYKDEDKRLRKERSKDISEKHFDILKKSNRDVNLVQFIMEMKDHPEYAAFLDSVTIKDATLKTLLDDKSIGEKELLEIIKDPKVNKELMGHFLLYKGVSTEGQSIKKTLHDVNKIREENPNKAQEIASDQRNIMDQNFVIEKAQKAGIELTRKTNIKEVEQQLVSEIEVEVDEILENSDKYSRLNRGKQQAGDGRKLALDTFAPKSSPTSPTATEFFNGQGLSSVGRGAAAA